MRITEDELDALPPKLSELMRALFVPTDGTIHVPNHGMNVVRLYRALNRATKANTRTRDGYNFIALRKIMTGEELTVDYHTYGADQHIATR